MNQFAPSAPKRPARLRSARSAFTLVEMSMAVLVMTVVIAATGSIVVLSAKASTSALAPAASVAATSEASDRMLAELQYATAVTEMTPTAITFTVADCTGDGAADTIRYAWSGAAGASLTRAVNGGAAAPVGGGLSQFAMTYATGSETATRTTSSTVTSGETLLSGFTGWAGITLPTNRELTLSPTTWGSEYFKLDRVTFPASTASITLTRARFMARATSGSTASFIVGVYTPSGSAVTPSATLIGSTVTTPSSTLGTSQGWVTVNLSGCTLQPSQTSLCLVLRGTAASSAFVRYYDSILAPSDTQVLQWTTNSGSSWLPASKTQYDIPHEIYGTYTYTTSSTSSTTVHTLGRVDIAATPSSRAAPLNSSVRLLNKPTISEAMAAGK